MYKIDSNLENIEQPTVKLVKPHCLFVSPVLNLLIFRNTKITNVDIICIKRILNNCVYYFPELFLFVQKFMPKL